MEANLIQQRNRETMNIFTNLVKALLLHEVDPTLQDQVIDPYRKEFLTKISEDIEYQDWLADRFFVFYLNRTRMYQGQSKPEATLLLD